MPEEMGSYRKVDGINEVAALRLFPQFGLDLERCFDAIDVAVIHPVFGLPLFHEVP